MTHVELESWIAKTLLLLKSPSEESVEELRNMLVETIHQKYNGRKQFKTIPPSTGCENTEKSKIKEPKNACLNDQKHKNSSSFSPSVTISPDSYSSDSDTSSHNSEMVILEDDVLCIICREGVFTQWNILMECAECHAVYHQQCHNPPVPESDARDPRVVWYCRNCTKTLNKPKTSSLSNSSQSSKSSSSSSSKLASGRSSTSSPSFGNKPFGGVSVSSKKSSSSKSSHSSSNKSHTSNINIISADKRLQIMKKKAARKQEKRPK